MNVEEYMGIEPDYFAWNVDILFNTLIKRLGYEKIVEIMPVQVQYETDKIPGIIYLTGVTIKEWDKWNHDMRKILNENGITEIRLFDLTNILTKTNKIYMKENEYIWNLLM